MKKSKIKPAVNQIELHPHLSQNRLVEFCKGKGITVTGFSPLGSGSYVELGMDNGQGIGLLQDPLILSLASKHSKSPAQILLRWGVQRGTAIIPKTSSERRLRENLDLFDFELEEEDVEGIEGLNRNMRYNDPGVFCKGMGGDYPIWD
ncbi:hypothetical protein TL16_g12941 [Triparma laevis f. inornata]|uniref:NADP-dependent oxidoreductase domain-containing protein n=1 Tax=Triparma laevis f. inornata TaxID=1714386 RepID=A0A9W7EXY7_9STRA|nr:hypothetical protein TL16_g12941 [Triparma laevis f. inornata]